METSENAQQQFERIGAELRRNPRKAGLWSELAELYLTLNQAEQAVEASARALHLESSNARARTSLAAALLALGDAPAAEHEARAAVAADESALAGWRVLGDALSAMNRFADAVPVLAKCTALAPNDAQVWHNLGLALDETKNFNGARAAFERAVAIEPALCAAVSQLAHLKRRLCDWNGLDALNSALRAAVRDGREGVAPFAFLTESPDAAEQHACAALHAQSIASAVQPLRDRFEPSPPSPSQQGSGSSASPSRQATVSTVAGKGRLRVGFVSSGFNNHPTGLLTVELIERLRGSRIECHGFATTASDGGALRRRLQRAFVGWHEVDTLSHLALAQRIRELQVEVLIDLRGYGGGSVAEVFALRPAPIQVNWLAYPGTLGAPHIDYLIADRYVVPAAQRAHFSEAIAYLRHCFQPSDSTRNIDAPPAREVCGLPPQGTVLASFNNSYKITPEVFGCWLRILAAVPDSVLWLLDPADGGVAAANLHRSAASAGVSPERILFMAKLPHHQYLARYRHVDLFLDTWPYGAHTTASDALFAGCPVLSLSGDTFAARVAGSLLTTLGLPELICTDPADYVAQATRLASAPEQRALLRLRLQEARSTSPLFDMQRYASDFEVLLLALAARTSRGDLPADP